MVNFLMGGYAKPSGGRDYYDEAKRNLIKQSKILLSKNIEYICCHYNKFDDYKDCIFYLDPPYKNTTQYGISKNFNHELFWDFARYISKNNIVFISEYEAPEDFECIWEQEVKNTFNQTKTIKATEKLFRWKGE